MTKKEWRSVSLKLRVRYFIYRKPGLFGAAVFHAHKLTKMNLLVVQHFTCEGNIWNLQNIFVPILLSKSRFNISMR